MRRSTRLIALTLIIFFGLAVSALAEATPKLLSTHDEWGVYTFTDNGSKVCFISTQPSSKEGDYKKRGEVFMFVTRWSNSKENNVVSISNGYTFKKDSTVTVMVGKNTYKMFTQGEMAWTKDSAADKAMTDDIRRSSTLTVEGDSKYGTHTKDIYNLKGSSDAYKAMAKACK